MKTLCCLPLKHGADKNLHQNSAEADATLRKPSSNLRWEEMVPLLLGLCVES